ncbi:MAG: hypothetical protein HYU75_11350, partial [Betaproteobacteria bacterium]|nr:hypothetical protein [Betaproteobacteria bacterium]
MIKSRLAPLANALCLLALFSAVASAAPADAPDRFAPTVVFEQAEFVLSSDALPPGDDAPWKFVPLPDDWRRSHPGVSGTGWYRMKFRLETAPAGVHGIFIPHRRSVRNEFYVNGALFGVSVSAVSYSDIGIPMNLMMPAALLKPGENVLHARVEALSTQIHGLPRVTFGGVTEIMARYIKNAEISINATRHFTIIALVVGLISLFVWLARPRDRAMLWYAMILMLAGFVSAYQGYLAADAGHAAVWDLVYTAVPLAGLAIFAGRLRPRPRWSDSLQAASLVLISALNFHEAARYFGWIDVDSVYIRLYHVPVMLFATGAAIFERHVSAMKGLEAMNVELEDRVRQKAAEIEAYHER